MILEGGKPRRSDIIITKEKRDDKKVVFSKASCSSKRTNSHTGKLMFKWLYIRVHKATDTNCKNTSNL